MSDTACKPLADPKPADPGLSAEVAEWVSELGKVWAATGVSVRRFARLHAIDKSTVSRYLNGRRVPPDDWFVDQILAILADSGRPVTAAVREHLTQLRLRAWETAHPDEYRVRLVREELRVAQAGQLEAERQARVLEEQLADRNRRIRELTDGNGRLRAAREADRVARQAEYERLTREIEEITGQLRHARQRADRAERRCQQLEDLLDRLGTPASAGEDSYGASLPVEDPDAVASRLGTLRDMGLDDQVLVLAGRAAAGVPVSNVRQLVRLLTIMREVGAIDQAGRLARRAAAQGRLDQDGLCGLDGGELVILLMILHAVQADDVIRRLYVVNAAGRCDFRQGPLLLAVLRAAGAGYQAEQIARKEASYSALTGRQR